MNWTDNSQKSTNGQLMKKMLRYLAINECKSKWHWNSISSQLEWFASRKQTNKNGTKDGMEYLHIMVRMENSSSQN
jgi:hypothetical protein